MTRTLLLAILIAASGCAADDLPITGLAHVGFRVSDLEKARGFYTGILGYAEAFNMKNDAGQISMSFFKVNDEQYIEIQPGLEPTGDTRLTHVAMVTSNIEELHKTLEHLGLAPSKINRGRDGNLNFGLKDPDGHRLEFVEYQPGSWHSNARGKLLGDNRISNRLLHAGVIVKNEAAALAFYRDKLGFREFWRGGPTDEEVRWINLRMPGARGDYIELMLYSKPPTRQQLGSMHHICLEVSDIQAAFKKAKERGVADDKQFSPRIGRNKHWQLNLFDPDGTRTELMEPTTVN